MNRFIESTFSNSIVNSIIILSAVLVLGLLFGRIKVRGFSFGSAGVLFSGILFGHFGMKLDRELLGFILEFGLILFIYTVGIQIGPAFFASFRKQGLKLNLLAVTIIALNILIAVGILFATGYPVAVVVGILSGAITNTPGLGAAQQVIREICPNSEHILEAPGLAYAISYPFGIMGLIITQLIFKSILKIEIGKEKEELEKVRKTTNETAEEHTLIVSNPRVDGKNLKHLVELLENAVAVSQLIRNNKVIVPDNETALQLGDIIQVTAGREKFEDLTLMVGDISELDLKSLPETLSADTITVTSRKAVGTALGSLELTRRFGVAVKKIERSGLQFVALPHIKLQFGDNLSVVGEESSIKKAASEIGDSPKTLLHPQISPIFIGIIIGLIIGSIPLHIKGLHAPIKLGIAGGIMITAIILGRIRTLGPLNWHLPLSANLVLREIGISFFLACVGLKSGGNFLSTLTIGPGIQWIGLGLLITVIPLVIMIPLLRIFLKLNFLTILGLVSGSCTNPPSLAYAERISDSDEPAIAFTSVYATTMILRILSAQFLVILFYAL